jgi:hypothetical protein
MSLAKLSTELDVHIVQYLEQPDVSSFSRTSKYYRRICEPVLYEWRSLLSSHHSRIKRLLFTLLVRSDLRRLIKHFRLVHGQTHGVMPKQHPSLSIPLDPCGIDGLYQDL